MINKSKSCSHLYSSYVSPYYDHFHGRIDHNGTVWYFKNHQLHRDDGPAVIWNDGTQFWFKNNEYHRLDGPAKHWPNKSARLQFENDSYYIDGQCFDSFDDFKLSRRKYLLKELNL